MAQTTHQKRASPPTEIVHQTRNRKKHENHEFYTYFSAEKTEFHTTQYTIERLIGAEKDWTLHNSTHHNTSYWSRKELNSSQLNTPQCVLLEQEKTELYATQHTIVHFIGSRKDWTPHNSTHPSESYWSRKEQLVWLNQRLLLLLKHVFWFIFILKTLCP